MIIAGYSQYFNFWHFRFYSILVYAHFWTYPEVIKKIRIFCVQFDLAYGWTLYYAFGLFVSFNGRKQ
jgi:hypothetical protein